ncbi:hypothetical protein [Streptomyces sp. SYSU K217416]
MTGTGQTVTQLRVPDKTHEITCFRARLEPFDLAGETVTADALHPSASTPGFWRRTSGPTTWWWSRPTSPDCSGS